MSIQLCYSTARAESRARATHSTWSWGWERLGLGLRGGALIRATATSEVVEIVSGVEGFEILIRVVYGVRARHSQGMQLPLR